MLTYTLLGVCLAIAILGFRLCEKSILLGRALIIAGVIASMFTFYVAMTRRTMGGDAWYHHEAFVYLVSFLAMVFGIFSSVLVHAITERRNKLAQSKTEAERAEVKLAVDRFDFLYAFLVSVPTFGVLLGQFPEKKITIVLLVLSYETGFFWDAVIGSRKERLTAAAPRP